MNSVPYYKRIEDELFRKAVKMIDAGQVENLVNHLQEHPNLIHQRIQFDEEGYFSNPALLEFIAENPIRNGQLPGNIVEIAKVILDSGAKDQTTQVNTTLALVASGRITREFNVQTALIDLLCKYGANPKDAMLAALSHHELEAAETLIKNGAKKDLFFLAAIGDVSSFTKLLPSSDLVQRHYALAFAAQFGQIEILQILVENGEDLNRYNPAGVHEHTTLLHQAVLSGNLSVVQFLTTSGADLNLRDKIFQGTPFDWAVYEKQQEIEAFFLSAKNEN